MDLWVWIAIFIVAWLLEALASAAKNKQRQQQQQQRPPRPQGAAAPLLQTRRAPSPPVPRQPPRTASVPASRGAPPPLFEVPVARPPRARQLEPTAAAEGVSAEVDVTEPPPESTDASHMRVTEKYRGPAPGEIGGEERARTPARFALRPRTAREAIVWMEILGPPRSERG